MICDKILLRFSWHKQLLILYKNYGKKLLIVLAMKSFMHGGLCVYPSNVLFNLEQ